ncbi:MAG: hypothetical protein D6753_17635 [Planctomycetota bacterium]|nr:MAG: hypothetical protein D6753_17635 [Planctomycetota bacterium]
MSGEHPMIGTLPARRASQWIGWLCTLTGASCLYCCLIAAAQGNTKPNIILILADDLSATVLPCYGGKSVRTPVLDRLAAEGMRYTHCYSPQVCMPSRCELLTGKYSHRNFVGRGNIAPGETTIASVLKQAGYATCQIEKWHLEFRGGAIPSQVGFDEFYHTRLAHNYFDPVVSVNGKEQKFEGGYGPHVCQKFAFDFIRRHQQQPFFLYYAMHLPHAPYHVPPGFDLGDFPTVEEKYYAMIAHQDALIGQLIEHLELLNLRDRTLLLFTGDNGTPQGIHYRHGDRTLEGGKGTLLDGGTHVPLIVNWPGTVGEGIVADQLVDFADFLPTLMELAGRKPRPGLKLDGRSFYRQLLGDRDALSRRFAFKFGCRNGGKGALPVHGYWARTQRWKLYNDGRYYDMKYDLNEEPPIELASASTEAVAAHEHLANVLKHSGAEAVYERFKKKSHERD